MKIKRGVFASIILSAMMMFGMVPMSQALVCTPDDVKCNCPAVDTDCATADYLCEWSTCLTKHWYNDDYCGCYVAGCDHRF